MFFMFWKFVLGLYSWCMDMYEFKTIWKQQQICGDILFLFNLLPPITYKQTNKQTQNEISLFLSSDVSG